ncbi:hypothetical protein KA478_02580 [Patescibacteria group bacterium]|nr:hypothetical protein [Patescibacteria group bacterium]
MGYKNFYYYKAMVEEGMNADIIFDLFESFYQKTNICLEQIRELEKLKP